MTVKSTKYRAVLLGAVGSAALFASPALAIPMPMAETEAAPNFGVGDSDSSTTTPTASSFSSFFSGFDSGSAFANARTSYEASVSAGVDGSGTASATATLSEMVTNSTAQTRDYFFTFQINGGSVGTDSLGFGVNSTDEASAIFAADVRVDSSSIWSLNLEVGLENEVFSVFDGNDDDDGVLLGYDSFFSDEFVEAVWDTTVFSVELGQLDPGESFTLDYILLGDISATYGNFCSLVEEEEGYGSCYFTDVGVSDPSAISSLGITSSVTPGAPTPPPPPPPTGVAEPASLALLGIGLAGLGLMRRRRFEL